MNCLCLKGKSCKKEIKVYIDNHENHTSKYYTMKIEQYNHGGELLFCGSYTGTSMELIRLYSNCYYFLVYIDEVMIQTISGPFSKYQIIKLNKID